MEKILTKADSTQGTFLTTPGANLYVLRSDSQSEKKEERKKQKRRIKEVDQISKNYQARRVSSRAKKSNPI